MLATGLDFKTQSGAGADNADGTWKTHDIEINMVVDDFTTEVCGVASYESWYGGFLDYTIKDHVKCPGEGIFVAEDITGVYTRGDGWTTDDDMDFYFGPVRPATIEEIADLWCYNFWASDEGNVA